MPSIQGWGWPLIEHILTRNVISCPILLSQHTFSTTSAAMLIHDTRASSGGRISQDLLATYVRYKQDTRTIIAWLISHGTKKYRSLNTISIKDMFSLAETVQRKAVAMPDLIDFHFREAIAARTEISRHFRQNDKADTHNEENTLNHEYFTTR